MRPGPIVMISSYAPRLCGIATFCEEAREFIQNHHPDRDVLVISHTDGHGYGVFPLMDIGRRDWWHPVAEKIAELDPAVIHIEHEYGLYEHCDVRGHGDCNKGFLDLIEALEPWPVVVEPHTVHGRLRDSEADFIFRLTERANMVIFKCHYQKWRLDWNFHCYGWPTPRNIMVIPHGARADRMCHPNDIPRLKQELGLDKMPHLGDHLVGLVGWIQSNKRWDILTEMWEEIAGEIRERTGEKWDLLAAGEWRDPNHFADFARYTRDLELLEGKGLAHFYEFVPRGGLYYKVMAVCDFVVLPSVDETQSGTLARIIALNKPYIATAPMEGLTAQTLESGGGLLFTNKKMLREQTLRLACDEKLRHELAANLRRYLLEAVSWEVVAGQYAEAYELATAACESKQPAQLPLEF